MTRFESFRLSPEIWVDMLTCSRRLPNGSPSVFWLFVISGLGFAGTGLSPAEMENGVALVTSPFTKGHFIMSLIHGIAWFIAALLLIRPMQRHPDWRGLTYLNVTLVVATLVESFALRGRLSDALVQRIPGAIYFAWFVVMSVRLIRIDRKQFQVTGG